MHIGTFAGYARRLEETSSRTALVAVLAELFAAATPDDVAPATYLLQGRLHAIAETAGSGSAARKVALLAEGPTPLDPASAAFVSRLPLGTLRLGLGDPTILDAYSVATVGNRSLRPRLERAYNETSDLGLIGLTLWERGIDAVDVLGIRVGNPVRPALAERLPSAEAILAQLGPCAVESKYDGFRCQVHKDGATVRIYSRSLEEMTDAFPEIARGVTTQIAAQTAIIEGEALAYHPASDEYLPFKQTMRRRRMHGVAKAAATLPLRLFAFDVLYADGERVAERPYAARHALLGRLIHAGQTIQVAPSHTVGTAAD